MEGKQVVAQRQHHQERTPPPPRACPRCHSINTKFCYYNNHCDTQPRYLCKRCRRHWTHGGNLRDIPIGGSSREFKRPRPAPAAAAPASAVAPPAAVAPLANPRYYPSQGGNQAPGNPACGPSTSEMGRFFKLIEYGVYDDYDGFGDQEIPSSSSAGVMPPVNGAGGGGGDTALNQDLKWADDFLGDENDEGNPF